MRILTAKPGRRPYAVTMMFVAAVIAVVLSAVHAISGSVVEADDISYQREVVNSKLPVILEFSATWCGACKKSAPMIEQMATELSGKVKVVRMDVDRSGQTSDKYRVNSIPAFFYIEGGKVKGQAIGALPKETLLRILNVPEEYWKKQAAPAPKG